MLKLLSSENQVLQVDDFYILEKSNGLDELVFNISIYDENYPHILEEAIIEYEQPYLIKAIDAGSDTAKVKCQLDLDELKADMHVGYSNNSNTLFLTVNPILPDGWVFIDKSGSKISRTIEGDFTPYDIITECASTYDVVFRFKPKERQIYAYSLASFQPLGTFASRELNLKEINYKGKSTDFFTRLYAYGEDGLSFADINDGNEYVDNFEYTDKIICTVLRDERYTTMEGLLEAAKKAVKTGGIPTCSYECTVYDLAATNPEMYSFQDFSLFSVVKLIDDIKKISVNHQVVEYKRYPKYPEKNVVTLSTTTTKLQNTVKNLKNEIENPQSAFRVLMQNTIDNMAASIAGYKGGNMIITQNDDGKPNGIMIMDTESQDTAKHVLWFNLSGITYSSNGIDGPYNSVWSFEKGGFVADWIVTGTMIADIIKTGVLSDATGNNYWNLETGELKISAYSTTKEIKEMVDSGALNGKDGEDAITLSITSSNGTIFKNSAIETVLTAHVYQAGAELTSAQISALGTIKWYKDGSTTACGTGATLTIDAGDVTNKATYIAQLEGNDMAVKASNSITLSSVIDVKATYRYYLLQSSTLTAPSKPTTFPPASTWDDTEATYTEGSTNSLYTVDCTVFSDDTFSYSSVSLSSSYEAAKSAYNKALNAQNTANDNAENIESLTETVLNQNTEITTTCESIILEATKELVATGDFESFQQTVSSQLEVLNNEITMKFTAANEELQTINGQLTTKLSQYEKHISFSENGIGIHDANGEQVMELWLDSGLIKFIRGGQQFGSWDGEDFYTSNIVVEVTKRVQLGPYAFVPRANGHMSLLKVE